MLEKESYPLYHYCHISNIQQQKGQLISIIGKITSIDLESETLTLQIDPINNKSINVIVPQFQINYLFDENALDTLVDKEDLQLAEKFINNKQKPNSGGTSLQTSSKEDGNYTSLMWFAVAENDPLQSKKTQELEQQRSGINSASLVKNISVNQFRVNQHLQVRGKCINEQTVEMHEFTDFQENFDLQSHNYALDLGIKYCNKILA